VIGLTGGIGAGKSSAAELFAALGAEVIDCDALAREVVAPGSPGLAAVRAAFGEEVIGADGSLDRARLRARIFADASDRARLEGLLHPRIRELARARVAAARGPYVLLVVPLLLEREGYRDLIDRVLVVDAPEEAQLARVEARDGCSRAEAERILAAQLGRRERLARADDVLTNDGPREALAAAVAALHRRYLGLARRAARRASP